MQEENHMKKIITASDPFNDEEQDWLPYDEMRKREEEKEEKSKPDKKKESDEDKE